MASAQPSSQFQVNGQTFQNDFEAALFIILKSRTLTLGKFLEQAIEEHKELQRHHWKMALLQDEAFVHGRINKLERLLSQEFDEDDKGEQGPPSKKPRQDDGCSSLEDSEEDVTELQEKCSQSPLMSRTVLSSSSSSCITTDRLSMAESPVNNNNNSNSKGRHSRSPSLNDVLNSASVSTGTAVTPSSIGGYSSNASSPKKQSAGNHVYHRGSNSSGSSTAIKNIELTSSDDPEIISNPADGNSTATTSKSSEKNSAAESINVTSGNNSIAANNANKKLVQVNSASFPTELLKQCEILFKHAQQHMPELENVMSCIHCAVPPKEILMDDRTLFMCYNKQCKLSNKPQINRIVGWRAGRVNANNNTQSS